MMPESNEERILLVDDEEGVLEALQRRYRREYDITPAHGPEEALQALVDDGPFAVVVTDYRMPRMSGTELLAKVREHLPEAVPVMLSGHADFEIALDAVNRGHIFRFLTKPCDPDTFRSGLDAALEQYRLRNAERLLLEQTVNGCVAVLSDVLALANPAAFGKATRIREHVRHVVRCLGLREAWQFEVAALLSQIGCVAVPNDVIDRIADGEPLSAEQEAMVERHPAVARDMLRKIPRLQTVAEIILHQRGGPSAGGVPRQVLLGGRILAAATDFDEILALGGSPEQALATLRQERVHYDDAVLDALSTAPARRRPSAATRLVSVGALRVGMCLDEDVRNVESALIVTRGHEVTETSLRRLRNYAELGLLQRNELRVLAGTETARDSDAA